jgi:hypothetical protein
MTARLFLKNSFLQVISPVLAGDEVTSSAKILVYAELGR